MLQQSQSYHYPTREAFAVELDRANISLSPFPFERKFESFESDENIILYRCIDCPYNPNRVSIDWSLSIPSALEYLSWKPEAQNSLLITQISKEELKNNIEFYSRSGRKIGLKQSPEPSRIVACLLANSLFTEDVLASMTQVLRMAIDLEMCEERGTDNDFNPADLQFKSLIGNWQTAVLTADAKEIPWPLSPEVIDNYNQLRGERKQITY